MDNVEGLGNFLEVEGIDVEERELIDFFNKIKILFNLKEEVITKSYLELMVNALDHSNSN
ncbi:hypothetical protein [Metallosphaera hakonensis]|uniref:hypothetical protein n=1 Tax=Metallosphaera hakonensis TaxID=79601 RepID=UPI002093F8DB|nr:hypothetical protein [Metallosphaera hakonensis]